MDSISNKIVMKHKLNTSKKIDQALVESHNYKILADIEGELTIYINDELFFFDELILLMEFAIELSKWLEVIKVGLNKDFCYETMDFNESPILEFTQVKNNDWSISSIWQKFESKEAFSLQIIKNAVDVFLSNLTDELRIKYSININDFF